MGIVINAIHAEDVGLHPNHHPHIRAWHEYKARNPHYINGRGPHFLCLTRWDATVTRWDATMPRWEAPSKGRRKVDITTTQAPYENCP
ncbi:MAG: hypothetical protein ACE5KI_05710 [Dehalococcoidia bacterium]